MRSFWPTGGLWRHRDFLKLWSAETISQFGSQVAQLALPLVAILVLDASAFEVAALATVEFLPFILFTLPAGVWVDRLPRRPILIVGDFGRAALLATIPIAYVAGRADARAALRRRLPRRHPHRLLRRRVPVVPPVARRPRPDHRRQLEARDQPLGGAGRRAGARRRARPGLHRAVRGPPRRAQLRRLRPLPPRESARRRPRPRSRRVDGRKPSMWTELQGGPALRPRQPEPARAGRAARRRRTSSRASRSRSSSSSPFASSTCPPGLDRARLLGRSCRLARRRVHRDADLAPLRGRPDDDRHRGALRAAMLLVAFAPAATPRSRSSSPRSSSSASRSSSTTSSRSATGRRSARRGSRAG